MNGFRQTKQKVLILLFFPLFLASLLGCAAKTSNRFIPIPEVPDNLVYEASLHGKSVCGRTVVREGQCYELHKAFEAFVNKERHTAKDDLIKVLRAMGVMELKLDLEKNI